MKKMIIILLLLMFLFIFASYAEVYDLANLLSEQEESLLNNQMEQIKQTHKLDMMLITTNESLGKEADLFAAEFYETKRSQPLPEEALIVTICMDIRNYGEAARGKRIEKKFTYSNDSVLDDIIAPHLTQGDYFEGFKSYLQYVDEQLTFRLPIPIIVVVSATISVMIVLMMIKQMKHAKPKDTANQYAPLNTLNLSRREDIYLYKAVKRERIQKSNSSGSSGSGRAFSSSSGNSYGGRSGKF